MSDPLTGPLLPGSLTPKPPAEPVKPAPDPAREQADAAIQRIIKNSR